MEVVPSPSTVAAAAAAPLLPLLALPSGATQKRRKRHNALDEREEELLRIQIRQHFGSASVYHATKKTQPSSPKKRSYRRNSNSNSNATASESAPLTGDGSSFDLASLGVLLAAPHKHFRLRDAWTLVKRLLWVSDEDMNEEINANDPKIIAGKLFLKGVEEFALLSENELAQLVGLSELRTFKAGDVVVDDERDADGLYIVLSGSASRYTMASSSTTTTFGGINTSTATASGPDPEDTTPMYETFAYQEHFGCIISPTEAAEAAATTSPETAVVATSELLECFWIPEVVIRMLNVQPRMEYEFALILHNHKLYHQQQDAHQRAQEEIVANLVRAGIHVTVLANTRNTTYYIVLLLSAPLALLAREDKLMAMDRIVENQSSEEPQLLSGGDSGDSSDSDDNHERHAETMSASDRIAAFASILTRPTTDKPPGAGLQGIEPNLDAIVKDIFPLHDPSMTDFILSTWFKETHSASTKRLFLVRIKDYFGLRIAFFTAFVRLYNAALVYPLTLGCLLWVFVRWIHYRTYVKALGVYGLGIAFLWAPSFIKRWLRYQNSLLVEWNLLGATEVALPNPQFRDYVVETINVASTNNTQNNNEPADDVEVKTYDSRKRYPKYAIFALFCVFCLILLFLLVGFYVQWYIIAVMTPMCTDPRCPTFLQNLGGCEAHCHELFAQGKKYLFMAKIETCTTYCDTKLFDKSYYDCDAPFIGCFQTEGGALGTARWFYVLVQGIVLGLTLDIVFLALFEAIASGFNEWENYATEQEKEKRFIEKIFVFNWVGYFYWFFLLAFCYVPNGANVQEVIRELVDKNWLFTLNRNVRFSRYWVDGLISMDSAFVTPMIVTQALNLVINTFVPYLLRRAIVKARDSYHIKKEKITNVIQKKRDQHRHKKDHQATATSTSVTILAGANSNTLEASMSSRSTQQEASALVGPAGQSDLNVLQDLDLLTSQWLSVASDFPLLDRHEIASMLSQREPVRAELLEASIHALFASVSSHESHMQTICSGCPRDELDLHQRTSYDWLDRVTRNLEERGSLKALWDASSTGSASKDNEPDSGSGSARRAHDGSLQASESLKLQLITQWQCRNYNYTADRILEESSMPIYSPFNDLLHLGIQFSYTIMFSIVWPFICLCSFARNSIALRFDAIKMTIDCKRPIPRRTIGIGNAWLHAFMFEIFMAQLIVPGLFVYVSGQLDAFFENCTISATRYGPAANANEPECGLDNGSRLQTFVALENLGILMVFLISMRKSDISSETQLKIVQHSRKLRHHVRKSVRMIGETILVLCVAPTPAVPGGGGASSSSSSSSASSVSHGPASSDAPVHARRTSGKPVPHKSDLMSFPETTTGAMADPNALFAVDLSHDPLSPRGSLHRRRTFALAELGATKASLDGTPATTTSQNPLAAGTVEWREGTVAWVKSGRVKVNFSGGRQLTSGTSATTSGKPPLKHESEVWLSSQDKYTLMEPQPVRIFELGMQVLLASTKFGRWLSATVVDLDTRDRFGKELVHTANEMHFRFVEGQNLRTHVVRQAVLMDPYCVLTVGGAPDMRHATSVKRSTLNPVWEEPVVFALSEKELYGTNTNASGTNTNATRQTHQQIQHQSSTAASSASSRSTSHTVLDKVTPGFSSGQGATTTPTTTTTAGILSAAAAAIHNHHHHHHYFHTSATAANAGAAGVGLSLPRRTLKVSVLNNDTFASGECIGEVEIDLNQFRNGQKHRLMIPLSQKRHIWTLDAIQSVMRQQAMGAMEYPMLGMPHILIEMQWIDTRLPTKVTVRVQGQAHQGHGPQDLVLSRKFCETNLCYGVDPERIVQQ